MTTFTPEKIILNTDNELILRGLQSSDVATYLIFSEIIAEESTHTLHYKGQSIAVDKMSEKWKMAIESEWQLELGGFDDDRLISYLSLFKPRPYHPFEKHIGEFAIKIVKEYWCCGLGSKMIEILENTAKKMDIKRLQATVRTRNHIGISFYRKHGFEIEGVKKDAAFINGVYENEFYIAKIL